MRDETKGSRLKLIADPRNNIVKYWPDTSAHLCRTSSPMTYESNCKGDPLGFQNLGGRFNIKQISELGPLPVWWILLTVDFPFSFVAVNTWTFLLKIVLRSGPFPQKQTFQDTISYLWPDCWVVSNSCIRFWLQKLATFWTSFFGFWLRCQVGLHFSNCRTYFHCFHQSPRAVIMIIMS